jgi:hypothetical protein
MEAGIVRKPNAESSLNSLALQSVPSDLIVSGSSPLSPRSSRSGTFRRIQSSRRSRINMPTPPYSSWGVGSTPYVKSLKGELRPSVWWPQVRASLQVMVLGTRIQRWMSTLGTPRKSNSTNLASWTLPCMAISIWPFHELSSSERLSAKVFSAALPEINVIDADLPTRGGRLFQNAHFRHFRISRSPKLVPRHPDNMRRDTIGWDHRGALRTP